MYSLEEIGLYSVLLDHDWNLNGLPVEAEKLAKLARVSVRKFRALWVSVSEHFIERDGRYYNPRLEIQRAKQAENSAKKSDAAKSRWSADAHADASAPALHPECSLGAASSSTTEQSLVPSPDEEALIAGLPEHSRPAWRAEIGAAKDGMHGPPLSQERVDRACREYVGNGHLANPSLRHFRGFLNRAAQPSVRPLNITRPTKQESARSELAAWAAGDSHGN